MTLKGLARRVATATPTLTACAMAFSVAVPLRAAERTEVSFPGDRSYPESITATSDGTLIAGSLTEGGAYRVLPGGATAERWIPGGANDSMSTLGVLADEKTGTLWVCSSDLSAFGVPPPGGSKPVAVKAFDLRSGAPKGSYALPGGKSLCNDMALGPDGTVYVTDSFQPHVLRLKPGATALEVWAEDAGFGGEGPQLDGIAIASDGAVYVNTYVSARLLRIEMDQAGNAGRITPLQLSAKLDHPDGMRSYEKKGLLLTEGGGRFDIVHLDGDKADIEVVKDGYQGPCTVVQVGNVAWVVEGQQNTLFDPKGGTPTTFRAYAISLPR